MFIFSKIVGWFTQPLFWLYLLLLWAWVLSIRRPKGVPRVLGLAVILLAMIGWQPLPERGIRELERLYPEIAPAADLSGYAGIVVLGGGTASGRLQQRHAHPLSNDAGERLAVSAALALRNPKLPLIYTGGEGDPQGGGMSEAERARVFYDSFHIPPTQVQYEAVSRNTYENALLSAKLKGINPQGRWLLLTSAWHMPRAVATFEKAGWNVTAYPVDYRAEDDTLWAKYSLLSGANDWQLLLNELLGIVAYRLAGRL